jgi:hypothetical protein
MTRGSSAGVTTALARGRSVRRTVQHTLPETLAPGTRIPVLTMDARRSRALRWTLLLPGPHPRIDEHRGRLAAEAVTVLGVAGLPAYPGAVLVDSDGIVQFAGRDVEDALEAIVALRDGARRPAGPLLALPPRVRSRPCSRTSSGIARAHTSRRRTTRHR